MAEKQHSKESTVFQDYDILQLIFSHLQADGARSQLARCAVTCKYFYDPALDVLWRCMETLRPLLRLISSFNMITGSFGEVTEREWQIFDSYARRVQILNFTDSPTESGISLSSYIRLASRSPIFPVLRTLSVKSAPATTKIPDFSTIFLFTSPNLTRVHFDSRPTTQEDSFLYPFLKDINRENGLTALTVLGQTLTKTLGLMKEFSSLRSLDISSQSISDFGLLRQLGDLGSLRSLSLDFGFADEVSTTESMGNRAFPMLESLYLVCKLRVACWIFGKISSAKMARIELFHPADYYPPSFPSRRRDRMSSQLTPSVPHPQNELQDCITTISDRWAQTLITFSIHLRHIRAVNVWNSNDLAVTPHIEPTPELSKAIVSFPHLSELKLAGMLMAYSMLQFSDMPRLQHLTLPDTSTKVPIQFLELLAVSCPQLKTLHGVALNTQDIGLNDPGPLLNHRLEVLSPKSVMGPWPIQKPSVVARHLDRIFPFLKSIETGSDSSWVGVEEMLKVCQLVRGDSEQRAMKPS